MVREFQRAVLMCFYEDLFVTTYYDNSFMSYAILFLSLSSSLVPQGGLREKSVSVLLGLRGADWGKDGVQSSGGCTENSIQ